MVSVTLRKTLPPLTEGQKARLKALDKIIDQEIDYSDIRKMSDDDLSKFQKTYKPLKTPVTARIDVDVVEWLKETSGVGRYQTRMNEVLRKAMNDDARKGIAK